MINVLWLMLIIAGIFMAAFTGQMDKVSEAIFQGATDSVKIIIDLIGPMTLWLGIINIAKDAGLTNILGKIIEPIFHYLFPDIPKEHPASSSILFNLTANLLGLGNSATPLGIKAMQELQELNKYQERASFSMCTLLALNTSSVTLVPATIISLRIISGSKYPAIIFLSTLFATTVSTITALLLDRVFRYFSKE